MTKQEVISAIEIFLDEGFYDREWFEFGEIERAIQEAQYRLINGMVKSADERGLRTSYKTISSKSADAPDYAPFPDYVGSTTADGYQFMYPRGLWASGDGISGAYDGMYNATYIPTNQIWQHDDYYQSGKKTLGSYYTVTHTHQSGLEGLDIYFTDPSHKNVATLFYIEKPKDFIVSGVPSGVRNALMYTNDLALPREYHHKIVFLAAEILNNRDVMEYERANIAVREMGMINKFDEMVND
jgi:hypothetical protein